MYADSLQKCVCVFLSLDVQSKEILSSVMDELT